MKAFSLNLKQAIILDNMPDISPRVASLIGQTLQLKAQNGYMVRGTGFAWESSNTAVATVSANGLITAVGPGTAIITVYTTGNSVINQNHVTIHVGTQTMGIGSGSVDQSDAE